MSHAGRGVFAAEVVHQSRSSSYCYVSHGNPWPHQPRAGDVSGRPAGGEETTVRVTVASPSVVAPVQEPEHVHGYQGLKVTHNLLTAASRLHTQRRRRDGGDGVVGDLQEREQRVRGEDRLQVTPGRWPLVVQRCHQFGLLTPGVHPVHRETAPLAAAGLCRARRNCGKVTFGWRIHIADPIEARSPCHGGRASGRSTYRSHPTSTLCCLYQAA